MEKLFRKLILMFLMMMFISPIFAESHPADPEELFKQIAPYLNMNQADGEHVVAGEAIDTTADEDEEQPYTFGLIPTEDLDIHLTSHLYVDTTMLYGYPTVGATWDIGLGIDTVTIAVYLRYSHFFKPLGSDTGNLYIGEEMGELGLSFKVRAYELGRFNVNFGINTGWYQQWLMYRTSANTYNLVNNGLIIRPEASIGWNWIGRWNMEIGLFYQTPLYPSYEGYEGWGVYFKIV